MSKNFVSYNDIEAIIEKIKLELDKKAVVVAITKKDYDALTEEEQNNGTIYFIIDYNEISGGGITTKLVIKGYYNSEDGKFYNEPSFSTETTKSANYLYIDLAENIIYIYNSTTEEFSALGGGQSDGITKVSMNGEELTVTDGEVDLGTVLTEHQNISGKQNKDTAVKYNGSSAVGSVTKGVYVDASGNATAMTYELNKTVPADAKFTDTNTWLAMVGATDSTDGSAGYVPAPPSYKYNERFLRGDGAWAIPQGLLNDEDRYKLDSMPYYNFVRQIYSEIIKVDLTETIIAGEYPYIQIKKQFTDAGSLFNNFMIDANILGVYIEIIGGTGVVDSKIIMFHYNKHKRMTVGGIFNYSNSENIVRAGQYSVWSTDITGADGAIEIGINFDVLQIDYDENPVIKFPYDCEWGAIMYFIYDNNPN